MLCAIKNNPSVLIVQLPILVVLRILANCLGSGSRDDQEEGTISDNVLEFVADNPQQQFPPSLHAKVSLQVHNVKT